jgi:hypothetical protein
MFSSGKRPWMLSHVKTDHMNSFCGYSLKIIVSYYINNRHPAARPKNEVSGKLGHSGGPAQAIRPLTSIVHTKEASHEGSTTYYIIQ